MSKTITIPKNRDNKSSKIVFPEICPGCFLNKVDSRTNNRESSSFITTENLSDFFTASIIYIGNIHRLFIPQMALWLEIPACKKCSKKSRILMILMYFFEIIGATSFALGVILGFFISESAKDAMVPILGTFFGIGIWGTPITILLIKYSFKIKHLEPDGKGDNFQISNEQYAKEFAILNNCWTKEQEEENSRKFCSICNLILHKPLYFVSKSNQRDHDKFVNDICHKCGNPLVDINTQKDSESQLLQNLKFEIFNVKKQQNKTLDTVSSISGVMWFISALAGLVLFFLNLI